MRPLEEKKNYKRVERSYGSFYRRFSLPNNIDPKKIPATGKGGMLEIVLLKTEALRSHKNWDQTNKRMIDPQAIW
ncbi:MAG: Hsp20/alpha crystallin family protein [Sedimenticolaceae bacterium]